MSSARALVFRSGATVDSRQEALRERRREYVQRLAMDGDHVSSVGTPESGHADTNHADSVAKRFEETMFHRSMEAHFLDGVPWAETRIERLRSSDRDTLWHHSGSPSEIVERCYEIDDLYESMRLRGCLPNRELNAEQGYAQSFSSAAEDEILVDVGRGGELLFVDGRHRLSVAKVLDLDEIPVLKRVRHSQYVNRQ